LPANDSASFPFRFINVHCRAVGDWQREQFFEVPLEVYPRLAEQFADIVGRIAANYLVLARINRKSLPDGAVSLRH
jgi:hypothetical protein